MVSVEGMRKIEDQFIVNKKLIMQHVQRICQKHKVNIKTLLKKAGIANVPYEEVIECKCIFSYDFYFTLLGLIGVEVTYILSTPKLFSSNGVDGNDHINSIEDAIA